MRTDQLRNLIREIPAHQQCLLTETDGKAAPEHRQCLACRQTSPHMWAWVQGWGGWQGGEGSSAPGADVRLPGPSCKGEVGWAASLHRLHCKTKHELPASCLQGDKWLLEQICEHCYGSFPRLLCQAKKVLWRRRSTNHICGAVLRETARAEGLCLHHRKFASCDPNTSHLRMEHVPLTMHVYTVLLQGLCLLQQS